MIMRQAFAMSIVQACTLIIVHACTMVTMHVLCLTGFVFDKIGGGGSRSKVFWKSKSGKGPQAALGVE